jgi:hypothetical protein
MILPLLTLLAASAATPAVPAAQHAPASPSAARTSVPAPAPAPAPTAGAEGDARPLAACMEAFKKLHADGDRDGCLALWRANPHWALLTLGADLEQAAALADTPDGAEEAAQLRVRALWGARLAEEALDLPLVTDYVAAFTGWDLQKRVLYRAEQAIYERATEAFAGGDIDMTLEAGREVVQRSLDLGDWWGAALAHMTVGEGYRAQGSLDDALIAFAHARVLFRELGLVQDELAALQQVAVVCNALERDTRGREAVRQALLLGARLEQLVPGSRDDAKIAELLRARLAMESRQNDGTAAAATRRELDALGLR